MMKNNASNLEKILIVPKFKPSAETYITELLTITSNLTGVFQRIN